MNIESLLRHSAETLLHRNPLLSYREVEEKKVKVKNYLINTFINQENGFLDHFEPVFFTMLCLQYYSEENETYFENTFQDGVEALEWFTKYTTKENSYTFVTDCIGTAFEKNIKLTCVFEEELQKIRESTFKMTEHGIPLEQAQKLIFGLLTSENRTLQDHGVEVENYFSLN